MTLSELLNYRGDTVYPATRLYFEISDKIPVTKTDRIKMEIHLGATDSVIAEFSVSELKSKVLDEVLDRLKEVKKMMEDYPDPWHASLGIDSIMRDFRIVI